MICCPNVISVFKLFVLFWSVLPFYVQSAPWVLSFILGLKFFWIGSYIHMSSLWVSPGAHRWLYMVVFLSSSWIISSVLYSSICFPFSSLCPESWCFNYCLMSIIVTVSATRNKWIKDTEREKVAMGFSHHLGTIAFLIWEESSAPWEFWGLCVYTAAAAIEMFRDRVWKRRVKDKHNRVFSLYLWTLEHPIFFLWDRTTGFFGSSTSNV